MKLSCTSILSLLATGLFAGIFCVSPAWAKKKPADSTETKAPAAASNADASKAQVSATLAMASIKVSRLALAADANLSDVKEALGAIYDRQETATRAGLDGLRAAAGDKARVAAAVAAINAADDESAQYFTGHSDVKDKISKRVTILNAEIGQIARTPDAYVSLLTKAGLSGPVLSQAKTLAKEASQKAGGKTDGDSAETLHTAILQIHKLLNAKQTAALDAALSGK